MRVRSLIRVSLAAGALLMLELLACGDDTVCPPPEDVMATIQQVFPTSLHGSRPGRAAFYETSDGLMALNNIPMDSLACTKCHAPNLCRWVTR